jgi:hypothetical protein
VGYVFLGVPWCLGGEKGFSLALRPLRVCGKIFFSEMEA